MKVLWISNILFPEAQQLLLGSGDLKASGGWMLGMAKALLDNPEVDLYVATVSHEVRQLMKFRGEQITYYIIPLGKGNVNINPEYSKYWLQVNDDIVPDVVHIHGTEFSHGYSYLLSCGIKNVVISIQGLTSACYTHYYDGMSIFDIYKNITLRDILRGTIMRDKNNFLRRSQYEIAMLQKVRHVIGRTSWDKAHIWAINPEADYHFCNEILRDDFYAGEIWHSNKCKKYTIFISQASCPIKGLHQILKAMPLILRSYPDACLRIAGKDITKSSTFTEKLRISGYGKYIKSLIKRYHLKDKVIFTGPLNGEQMKKEYLNANVFLCPSSIENSPNSLGEAQILGTPCVASFVGGIMDMMQGDEEYLYRFDDIEMLAAKVCKVFADGDISNNMREAAILRHNPDINSQQLFRIYQIIVSSEI